MYLRKDCCESVSIIDINGDLDDLIGTQFYYEEVSNDDFVNAFESKFKNKTKMIITKRTMKATISLESCVDVLQISNDKGYVDIRWFGESNSYYSESVDFIQVGVDRE